MAEFDEFDPDRPESGGSSQLVSKKDVKWVGLILLVFFAMLGFVYPYLRENAYTAECNKNLRAISGALALYAENNDNRFPPAYVRQADGTPILSEGKVVTWLTVVKDGMTTRQTAVCPSADVKAATDVLNPVDSQKSLLTTYGMYLPIELRTLEEFANPLGSIAFAETSNHGAEGTYDPKPFEGPNDGFVIGFDSGNDLRRTTIESAKVITRLAFPGSANLLSSGDLSTALMRHRSSTHAVLVNGSLIKLKPQSMMIQRDALGEIGAPWMVPARAVAER